MSPEDQSASPSASTPITNSVRGQYYGKFEPTDSNAPKFGGINITDFLEEYNFEADRVSWSTAIRKQQVPYFCEPRYKQFIRKLPGYSNKDMSWEEYQKELCKLYASQDENRKRGTRAFIESYVSEVQRRQPMVKIAEYYQNFVMYFGAALARGQVMEMERGHFFFRGLAREDMDRVMHLMPKEDRPILDDLSSFKIDKIYEFVHEHQEQEEGLNALNTDFSAVSKMLAKHDAGSLEEPVPHLGIAVSKVAVPGVLQLPNLVNPVAKVDPAVLELIWKFDGLTLTVEQFNYLANSNVAVRRMLTNTDNYAEAYKRLVLRQVVARQPSGPLERNDGSFRSKYPPTMSLQAGTVMVSGREQSAPKCRCCGREGHMIAACPDLTLLKENRWLHTRQEQALGGWNQARYYFGPYPNDLWGVFPGGGFAPKAYGSEVLEWILKCLKERFQVTDAQLKRPIKSVLPSWFGADGKPIEVTRPSVSGNGETFTIEANEDGGALAQQTMALRAAAMFLENVTQSRGEVYNTEPSVYAVETRNKGVRKTAAEQHRKDNRAQVKKPVQGPQMKSGTLQGQILPSVEDDDELLWHRAVVDLPDTPMTEAQIDPLREQFGISVPRDSRSTTIGPEAYLAPSATRAPRVKVQPIAVPTAEELAKLARNTSPTVIAQAMLNQEVRGLRQVDLLATPAVLAAIQKALEDARQPTVRFSESSRGSGETMAVENVEDESVEASLHKMFEWGSQSGETLTVEAEEGLEEVITNKVLQRLCPRLSREQQEQLRLAEEANEVHDFQDYEIDDKEDGYVEEQSAVPTMHRMQTESQHRRYSLKGQLPTCWVSLHGGMGRALIDTGSQLNVMRLSTARALNVYITELDQSGLPTMLQHGMITADGSMDPFVGTAYQVPIMVGGVLIPTHFRVVRKLRRAILLSTSWCSAARLRIQFDAFGRTICYIKSINGQREVSFLGCDPAPTANAIHVEDEGKE